MKQSHKINFPMHGGHRIMHLSQKANNSEFFFLMMKPHHVC